MPIERTNVVKFSKLELIAKKIVEGFSTGLHKSPFHGFSVEFAEHRFYNPGESTKYIDWKLFARTEKLFVKRFEEETNLRCQIILDNSSSMYFPTDVIAPKQNKITFAIHTITALIEIMKKQRDAVGLSIFDTQLQFTTPAKSSIIHHALLYHKLESLTALYSNNNLPKETDIVTNLNILAQTLPTRSLIVLFTDAFNTKQQTEDLMAALQHLRHKKHEVILYHVADYAKELDFDFENRPYKFVDLETKEIITLQNNNIKEFYVEQVRSFWKNLKVRCGSLGIDFVESDINKSFDVVLLAYLLKRQKIKN